MELADKRCAACEGGVEPLGVDDAAAFHTQTPEWELGDKQIARGFTFDNFAGALAFVNRVGEIAEMEGHHPDIHLTDYKQVQIELTTHAIGGLSENDFIVAAKIDRLP